jgi:hypothetical protein
MQCCINILTRGNNDCDIQHYIHSNVRTKTTKTIHENKIYLPI